MMTEAPVRIWAIPDDDHGAPDCGFWDTNVGAIDPHAEVYVRADIVEDLRAAAQRQVDNIERWRETGIPATPEESKSIYDGLKTALSRLAEISNG